MTATNCESQASSNPGVTYVFLVPGLTANANAVSFAARPIVAMTVGPALAAVREGTIAMNSSAAMSMSARCADLDVFIARVLLIRFLEGRQVLARLTSPPLSLPSSGRRVRAKSAEQRRDIEIDASARDLIRLEFVDADHRHLDV